MPCRNYRPWANSDPGIDGIYHVRIRNRINLVHPDQLGIAAKYHFVTAANDVQVADANMIAEYQTTHTDNDVEVANARVVPDLAAVAVDYAETDPHTSSNFVTKEQAITGAL